MLRGHLKSSKFQNFSALPPFYNIIGVKLPSESLQVGIFLLYKMSQKESLLLRKLDSKGQGRYEILLLATIIFVILQSPANYITYMKVVGIET